MEIKKWIIDNNVKSPYLTFAKNKLSQFGEDGIIEQLLIELYDNNIKNYVSVEFGAWDGVYLSNIYDLWRNKNINAILIESNHDRVTELTEICNKFNNVEIHETLVSSNSTEPSSLDNILTMSKFDINDENFILLSIDVDGLDYNIWESVNKYKPIIVLIEIAGGWGVNDEYIGIGASLKSLNILGNLKGYTLICATGNAFFVRNDKITKLKNYNSEILPSDLYVSNDIVVDVLSRLDEYGNITNSIRFLENSYHQLVTIEKEKIKKI